MANISIPNLPIAVTLDGSEQLEIVQPPGTSLGVSKRATSSQIGNTANIGAVSLGIVSLPQLNIPNAALDFIAILHTDGNVYKINPSGLSLVTGNMPAGGTASQFLIKASSTNYDTLWATMTGDVSMSGTASFTATIATAAVTYAKIQQVGAKSILGVAGNATAVVGAITGSADQALVINSGGTGVGFGLINIANIVTGTLGVPFGGTGRTTLAAFGVVVGADASAVNVTVPGTAGQALLGQTATSAPLFITVGGDLTITAAGTATIAANAVTLAKLATLTGLSVIGQSGTATSTPGAITGTTNQVLRVAPNGTSLGFGQLNLSSTSAITGLLTTAFLSGILAVPAGGTGFASATATGVLFGSGTGAIGVTAAPAANNVLVANSAGTGIAFGQVLLSSTSAVTGNLQINGNATLLQATAIPAGGSATLGPLRLFAQTGFGIYAGSGTPTLGAGTGSLYLRTDGNTTTSRLYVNSNGSTTWVAMVSNS